MIRLENICAGYENKTILNDINLQIVPGKITVIVGPNGCGKSTLLKTIVRIINSTSGNIFINNKNIASYSSVELAKHIAYLSQNRKVPNITALKLVLHGRFAYLKYPRKYTKDDIQIAKNALVWVNMEEYENTLVSKLSGGMQQKVYIAMALCQNAETILMDEPTAFLDIIHQLRLMEIAKTLAKQGKAVVMVLHDLTQAMQIADLLVVMNEGKILYQGDVNEVIQSKSIQDAFNINLEKINTKLGVYYVCTLNKENL